MTFEEKIALVKNKIPGLDLAKQIDRYNKRNPNVVFNIDNLLSDYPSFFTVRTGFSCNVRCIHCFTENKKVADDHSTEELKEIIDAAPTNTTVIVVTGGEPTVRSDLVEILSYIKDKGYINSIQTNGIKLGDSKYFDSVIPYIDSVFIPVHSNDSKIHDEITQAPGSWGKTVKGIENCLRTSGPLVVTNTVINQLNYKTLLSTFDFLQSINPGGSMTLTFPHPVGAAHSTKIVPWLPDVKEHVLSTVKKYAYLMSTHYIPKCYLYPYQNILINVDDSDDGSVSKPGIDYIETGWQQVDYGDFKQSFRVKSINCIKCRFDKECLGMWREYGELYPNDLGLTPIGE